MPRRRKRYFTCGNFFIKITARSKRCGSFPPKCPANLPGTPLIRFAPTYFLPKISHTPASLLLLFCEKSRSARLFVCKRTHDGPLSLSTFHDIVRFTHMKTFILLHLRGSSVRTRLSRGFLDTTKNERIKRSFFSLSRERLNGGEQRIFVNTRFLYKINRIHDLIDCKLFTRFYADK